MKKATSLLVSSLVFTAFFLTSCGSETKSTEVITANEPTPDVVLSPAETTLPNILDEKESEWIAVGEQSNLAPSDTPRGISEGGLYLPYTPTALAQASGNIVLFFYASWSPAGIATNKDITDKKDKISKDLTILRVNFDDADAMKQQYGITDQQTFVQVTNTGELIKKWRGANTLEDIVQQIQK